jgi:glycosyltransferase involved in cell wall biosynthesis
VTAARVGVVVPAYRETTRLDALLASLRRTDHPGGALHVVVAVDGADRQTVATAERHGVTVVPLPVNAGSYSARNAALDALPDDLDAVLFTDADCVVTPPWVSAHLAALADADLSGGGVRFTFRGARPTVAEWVDATRHLKQEAYVAHDGYAATCNLAVRAEVLRAHRFDGRLRTGGDAEFCRRVVAAGSRLVYAPDALVEHPARDLRELVTKVRRISGGVPGQAERWRHRQPPSLRLTLGTWRRARRAGHDVPLLTWGVPACLLDWLCTLAIARAVHRVQAAQRREAGA